MTSNCKRKIQIGYKEKVFQDKGGEALAHIAQRSGACPVPGDAQGQARQGSEQPDGVGGVPTSWMR